MSDDRSKRETSARAPGGSAETETTPTPLGEPGRTVGPYRLLQCLGEGGMGEVWLADQTTPVKRRVALKLIKPGMDTKQVIARFEAERQALAMMEHPSIAKVYDAGESSNGRPYFVMEYVKGVPITEHCDRQKLSNRERLQLFVRVCEGVQHAHQKAIIHRDLKPSNVLVCMQDGKAVPKIIDFGMAKATAQRLTERTLFTELGAIVGTPEYMSPEQAETTRQDIDTRTDVYSLGVILYELLTGALPFESKSLREAGYEGLVRKIREEQPSKPSTRVDTLEKELSSESARRRGTDVSGLRRQLSGDLDWITMKAIEKDRSRRYGSPQEFAADVERHLHHEPVTAGPPSVGYRAAKFIQRHRLGVGVAALIFLLLIAFGVTMSIQARRIAAERDRANREAEAKGQVSEFLENLFRVSDPGEARGNSITARELLDKGSERIESMLEEQPEVATDLMIVMGSVYKNLGLYSEAEPLFERALETRTERLGDSDPETLAAANRLAMLYDSQGRYDEAESLAVETYDKRRRTLGQEHPDTLDAMNNLALVLYNRSDYDEAEALVRETLEIRKRVLGERHVKTRDSMNFLAVLYVTRGRYDEAESVYREVIEIEKRELGEDHLRTINTTFNLARLCRDRGRYDEAEQLIREILAVEKRVLGEDHPETLRSVLELAILLRIAHRYDEVEPLLLATLERQRRTLGDEHKDFLYTKNQLGILYMEQGRYEDAERMHRETLETRQRVLGRDHPDTVSSMNNLADVYWSQDRLDLAEPLLLDTLEARRDKFGEDDRRTLQAMGNLAFLYQSTDRLDRGKELFEKTLRRQRRVLGDGHRDTWVTLYNLAISDASRGDVEAGMDWLRQLIDAGYSDVEEIAGDDALEPLHGAAFDALVEQARQRGPE